MGDDAVGDKGWTGTARQFVAAIETLGLRTVFGWPEDIVIFGDSSGLPDYERNVWETDRAMEGPTRWTWTLDRLRILFRLVYRNDTLADVLRVMVQPGAVFSIASDTSINMVVTLDARFPGQRCGGHEVPPAAE